ncbi:MAG: hypothetical protein N3F09_01445 [Bacteroidia bacterium]|nr:hypothetical protein [Bacteroidia bacterium]
MLFLHPVIRILALNIFFIINFFSQTTCFTGAKGIFSNCGSPPGGQGCQGGCDLSEFSWFGTMCNGTHFSGDCSNNHQTSVTTFQIPSGCTATISARVSTRCNGNGCTSCGTSCSNTSPSGSGCGASGLDSGDQLRVGGNSTTPVFTSFSGTGTAVSGTISNATGYTLTASSSGAPGNAGAILSYAQTGGTMFVGITVNRSDEIVTYTMTAPAGCCSNILPVDILNFSARITQNNSIELFWLALNENRVKSYEISVSYDGLTFRNIGIVAAENNKGIKQYSFIHHENFSLATYLYYKLSIINQNLTEEKFYIKDVLLTLDSNPLLIQQNSEGYEFTLNGFFLHAPALCITDITGRVMLREVLNPGSKIFIPHSSLPKGFYTVTLDGSNMKPRKIIVP